MAEAAKDTIYIDVDDEITNIIEKVKDSPNSIVALVLPKRATVLQSIVNMKLLQRSATNAKKKVVLITSEVGLLPLAGAVGVYVAKNLQTMPEIPDAPEAQPGGEEAIIDEGELDNDVDKEKTVGELAGVTAVTAAATKAATKPAPSAAAKAKKDSKLKIPNFEKFRTRLILIGLGVVALFVFLYWAFFVAPSAKITVVTDTSTIDTALTFTASPDAKALDIEDSVVPSKKAEKKEVATQEVAATGTKDVGTKASGTVTISQPCSANFPAPVDAGTGVSSGNLTYITQARVTLTPQNNDGQCVFAGSTQVVAQKNGDQYNIGAQSDLTVTGRSDLDATSTAMTGGTSKEIKVLTQADVNGVRDTLVGKDEEAAKTQLKKELEDAGFFALEESFNAGSPAVTSSPSVGSEATKATVTVTTTYTMTGVNKSDLEKLIAESAKDDIDSQKQQVLSSGLDDATFTIKGDEVTVDTIVTAGPSLNVEAITTEIAGKKRSQVESTIIQNPGVKEVRVDYSPFWVSNTPSNTKKIEIVFEDSSGDEQ
jgi:hypothetical protein